eukprot:UN34172
MSNCKGGRKLANMVNVILGQDMSKASDHGKPATRKLKVMWKTILSTFLEHVMAYDKTGKGIVPEFKHWILKQVSTHNVLADELIKKIINVKSENKESQQDIEMTTNTTENKETSEMNIEKSSSDTCKKTDASLNNTSDKIHTSDNNENSSSDNNKDTNWLIKLLKASPGKHICDTTHELLKIL